MESTNQNDRGSKVVRNIEFSTHRGFELLGVRAIGGSSYKEFDVLTF